ncbi:hypothetical protein LCGC14_2114580 [marine sediment metagenome]|uniref:Uncharacterized protein n=1 Tax=marine sediment metagenome TaxID=412755 RepID=A0A0F9ET76_9ZZZZ
MFERIGKIESTMLGFEDHGIPTFYLQFDFGGERQGFGGYAWGEDNKELKQIEGTAAGADLILSILKACGVDTWEEIAGKTMFALYDSEHYGQTIKGIKALPFEDGGTFLIREWQEKWFPKGGK